MEIEKGFSIPPGPLGQKWHTAQCYSASTTCLGPSQMDHVRPALRLGCNWGGSRARRQHTGSVAQARATAPKCTRTATTRHGQWRAEAARLAMRCTPEGFLPLRAPARQQYLTNSHRKEGAAEGSSSLVG
jgi:hypothetical protein